MHWIIFNFPSHNHFTISYTRKLIFASSLDVSNFAVVFHSSVLYGLITTRILASKSHGALAKQRLSQLKKKYKLEKKKQEKIFLIANCFSCFSVDCCCFLFFVSYVRGELELISFSDSFQTWAGEFWNLKYFFFPHSSDDHVRSQLSCICKAPNSSFEIKNSIFRFNHRTKTTKFMTKKWRVEEGKTMKFTIWLQLKIRSENVWENREAWQFPKLNLMNSFSGGLSPSQRHSKRPESLENKWILCNVA